MDRTTINRLIFYHHLILSVAWKNLNLPYKQSYDPVPHRYVGCDCCTTTLEANDTDTPLSAPVLPLSCGFKRVMLGSVGSFSRSDGSIYLNRLSRRIYHVIWCYIIILGYFYVQYWEQVAETLWHVEGMKCSREQDKDQPFYCLYCIQSCSYEFHKTRVSMRDPPFLWPS